MPGLDFEELVWAGWELAVELGGAEFDQAGAGLDSEAVHHMPGFDLGELVGAEEDLVGDQAGAGHDLVVDLGVGVGQAGAGFDLGGGRSLPELGLGEHGRRGNRPPR